MKARTYRSKIFCLACSAKFPSWFRPSSGLYHVNWTIAAQRARQHFCLADAKVKQNSTPKICTTLQRQILSCFQLPFHTVIFLIWPLTPYDIATPLYYPLNIAPLWSFIYLFIYFIYFQGQDRGYWSKHAPQLVQCVILVCNYAHIHVLNRPAFLSCHT